MQQRLANTSYIMIIPYVTRKLFPLISNLEWNIDFMTLWFDIYLQVSLFPIYISLQYKQCVSIKSFYYWEMICIVNRSNILHIDSTFQPHLQLTCYRYFIRYFLFWIWSATKIIISLWSEYFFPEIDQKQQFICSYIQTYLASPM